MNTYAYQKKLYKVLAYSIDTIGYLLFFARKKNVRVAPNIKKILVVRFDQLGDAFYFSPFFEHIQRKYPVCEVDILCTERSAPIFINNPFVKSIFTYNYSRFARSGEKGTPETFQSTINLIKRIRQGKYDVFVDPRGEPFVALLGFLSGARIRIGIAREEVGGFFYTHTIRYNPSLPAWYRFASMLLSLHISIDTWTPCLYPFLHEKKKISALIAEKFAETSFVAFHISAGFPFKMWPLEYFARLAIFLQKEFGLISVLLGSVADQAFAKQILADLGDESSCVIDMTGKFSLREVYEFLGYARIFVGNDSVLAHFAAARAINTIELINMSASVSSCKALGEKIFVFEGHEPGHRCAIDRCAYPCPNMRSIDLGIICDTIRNILV